MRSLACFSFVAVSAMICGCAMSTGSEFQQQMSAATDAQIAALAKCENQFPDPLHRPATPRVRCKSEANLSYARRIEQLTGHPESDLVGVWTSKQILLAEKFDGRELTDTLYDLEMAKAYSEFTTSLESRKNGGTIAAAAQMQAAAAAQQAQAVAGPHRCSTYMNQTTCY